MSKNLRIVFFGTPEIAAIELSHLVKMGYNVVGVVTNIDKPQGRGKQLSSCEVKLVAEELGLNILQPKSMKDESFIHALKELQADVFVVVAFRLMPKIVYSMPPLGTFNLHTSLLPEYRGAAPINWAIINGEKQTGITTFLLNDNIDCGEILLREKIEITEYMTAGELYDIMAERGKKLIVDTLDILAGGNYTTIRQDLTTPTKPAPKIFKQDTYINWENTSENIRNFVRGLAPYPAAKAIFYDFDTQKEYEFKVFEVQLYNKLCKNNIGDMWIENKSNLLVQCLDGTVELIDLQLNGKKRMLSVELIKGLRISGVLKKK